jgi:plastocyanin
MRLCYGLFLVFLAACGSGTSYSSAPPPPPGPPPPPPPPPAPGTVAVTVEDYDFTPSSISIKVGTPVQWTNQGAMPHNVTSDNGVFASSNLSGTGTDPYGQPTAGGQYTRMFSTTGTFAYHCSIHPTQMTGTITVTQ